MGRTVVFPYKMGSKSGRALAKGLGLKRIYADRNYKHKPDNIIINWGNSILPTDTPMESKVINHPLAVRIATNKLQTFYCLSACDVRIPPFTLHHLYALDWQEEGKLIVVRHKLTGKSGEGIELVAPDEELPLAPLYTQYVKKRSEYRVHVVDGEVIDYAQKKVREGSEGNNFQIRNLDGGWIYTREGVVLPNDVRTQSLAAVEALGLDFGAVDVGFNEAANEATVYEVNTACGLEGTTLERYVEAIGKLI